MTDVEIARQRLQNQLLVGPGLADPVQIVCALGAVQSQDYPNAKWAIGQRGPDITDADVERAFADGRLLRTHLLRPTWHLVAADDIHWLLALTASRVRSMAASYSRTLELDAAAIRKGNAAITRALRDGKTLTRAELSAVLVRAGLKALTGQHVAQLLMHAELDGVVCSGPRHGRQFTYALLDERAPLRVTKERDEALAELARRYFTTRGPATLHDFSWWSGLTVADARRGVEAAGPDVEPVRLGERGYWLVPQRHSQDVPARSAHLLPNYDEYFVGFKDRSAMTSRLRKIVTDPRIDALMGHVVIVNGQLVGGWRRTIGKRVTIEIEMRVALTTAERKLLQRAAERFGQFLALPVQVVGHWAKETT